MKKIIVLILTLLLIVEVAQADYTIGTATNMGSPVNSAAGEGEPYITIDGLELYFVSLRSGGYGEADIWVATRTTKDDDWGIPVNLGSGVNGSAWDSGPAISADGLSLFFTSMRPGGHGDQDIYMTTRPTKDDPWGTSVNLGAPVNTSSQDGEPYISADGLELYFVSARPGGYGNGDMYVTTRSAKDDPWGTPVNLGPIVNTLGWEGSPHLSSDGRTIFHYGFNRPGHPDNTDIWMTTRSTENDDWANSVKLGSEVNGSAADTSPCISHDGSVLYFQSWRSGNTGLWQVSIDPVVDLNADGIVDSADMVIMVDHWGTDDSLCDIGPMPWGDGIVDVQDLIVLAEHLFEEVP